MDELIIAYQCDGDGLGWCDRCEESGKWNRNWMCFLYEIEGKEGTYCSSCVKEIARLSGKRVEFRDRRAQRLR